MVEVNPFQMAQMQLDEAADYLGLNERTHKLLRWPMRELHVTIPIKMDDGTTEVFKGYRVQYNGARGPTKGGLRWHPEETIGRIDTTCFLRTFPLTGRDLRAVPDIVYNQCSAFRTSQESEVVEDGATAHGDKLTLEGEIVESLEVTYTPRLDRV